MSTPAPKAIPDDEFASRFRRVVEEFERWCFERTLIAEIAREQGAGYWRLAVTPAAANAAAIEIIVHPARQAIDLAIGNVAHEGLGPDLFEQLVSIAEGVEAARVETRQIQSALTGAPLAVETEVQIADGSRWSTRSAVVGRTEVVSGDTVTHVRHYTPWVREANTA